MSQENEDEWASARLLQLKNRIKRSGLPVRSYEAKYEGVVEERPLLSGLEKFAADVFDDLWGALAIRK